MKESKLREVKFPKTKLVSSKAGAPGRCTKMQGDQVLEAQSCMANWHREKVFVGFFFFSI